MESFYSNKTKLSEVATVYTENKFRKLCETDNSICERPYVAVPSEIIRGERMFVIIKGELPTGHIAIVPNKVHALYLLFFLNSTSCQYELFEGDFNIVSKIKVNRKKLVDIIIPCTLPEIEEYYCYAEFIRLSVNESESLAKTNMEKEFRELLYQKVVVLCDSLAFEILTHPFLIKNGVEILKNWIPLVDEHKVKNDLTIIVEGLHNSDSILRNQLMKLPMVANNFELAIKNSLKDGMED